MDTKAGRETFVSVADVLSGAAKKCLEAEADLKVLARHGSDPLSMACEEIAGQEHRLAVLLADFSGAGPDKLLATRFQYTPEETVLPPPGSAEDAIARLVQLNYELSENLRELTVNMVAPEMADSLDLLRGEVESLGQKISMISVSLQDY